MRLIGFGLLVGLSFWAPSARAGEGPIHLDFRAPAGCPGRDEFIAHVRARTEKVRFVDGDAGGVSELYVKADYEGDRAIGRLRFGEAKEAERLVTGKTCLDVISALALIAAVAIDPTVISDPLPSQAAVAPSASAPTDPATEQRTFEPPRTISPAEMPEPREAPVGPLAWFGGTGAHGEIARGFGPKSITLAGGSLFGEVGLDLDTLWRPAVRLAAVLAASSTVRPEQTPDSGAATFTLLAARLSLCPLEFAPRPSFRVRPCADVELGQLTGQGQRVENGSVTSLRKGTMTRVALGQTLQGRVRLASRLWLEMEAGLREPLLRQNFVFHDPDVTVASVAVIEVGGGLGLGLHFP